MYHLQFMQIIPNANTNNLQNYIKFLRNVYFIYYGYTILYANYIICELICMSLIWKGERMGFSQPYFLNSKKGRNNKKAKTEREKENITKNIKAKKRQNQMVVTFK